MAQVADRVVAELEARNGAFNANVRGSAAIFDQSMSQIERSATRAERMIVVSNGAMANSVRNLSFQLSDIGTQLASGTSPFLILAQQGPQVTQALGDIRASGASLGAVLKGIALPGLLAILSILPPLISKLFEASAAKDDLKRSTDAAAESERILQDVLQGTIDLSGRARLQALELAKARALEARATLNAAEAQLKLAKGYLLNQQANAKFGTPAYAGTGVRQIGAAARVDQKQLAVDLAQGELKAYEMRLRNIERVAEMASAVEAKREADKADKKGASERRKAEAAARRAERAAARAAEEDARNRRQFANELARSRIDLLDAEAALTADTRLQDEVLRKKIVAERDRAIGDINADPDRTRPEKDQLAEIENRIAEAKLRKVNIDEAQRYLEEELSLRRSTIENERDILDAQGELTDNSERRREIALRLLDLAFQQERAQLEAVIASKKSTEVEKEIANQRLGMLSQLQGLRAEQTRRSTEGPGAAYLRDLGRSTDAMGEDIDRVAVDGLERLNDQLVDAIMNSKSLGEAFKNVANQIIADLIRIAIQQAIVKPLAEALFGGGGGGGGGFLGSVGSLFGSIFGGFRANGGPVSAGRPYIVGERGPELMVPAASGSVISNHALARAARPDTRPVIVSSPQFDLRGAVVTRDLYADMERISQANAQQAAIAMGKTVMQNVPQRVSQFQIDGT